MKTTNSPTRTHAARAHAIPSRSALRSGVKAGDLYQWYNNIEETSYRGAAAGPDNPSLRN